MPARPARRHPAARLGWPRPRRCDPRARLPAMPEPVELERWLADLGIEPGPRVEREALSSWDISLDGRRRVDLRLTIILDPTLGAVLWAHLAPPIGDGLRKAYLRLLRWNDEFPFAIGRRPPT